VIHFQSPFRHHFFQIPIAQAVAQIPAQTQHNKFTLEMAPLENGRGADGYFRLRWFAVSGLTLSYPIIFCDRAIFSALSLFFIMIPSELSSSEF
jgi:hypothetical protein